MKLATELQRVVLMSAMKIFVPLIRSWEKMSGLASFVRVNWRYENVD